MSLAARTRFSSCFLAVLMLHLSSSIANAGEDDFFIKEIMKEQQPNMNRQLPDWLKTKPAALSPVFEQLLREGNNGRQINKEGVVNIEKSQSPGKPIQGRWIFVSMGMPNQELKAAAEEAAATKSLLVFRGVEKGGDTGTITRRLYEVVKEVKPVPGAVIDPTLFTHFNVQAVPTMIETNADGETRTARGLPGYNWMSKQDAGDLGQKGPVFGIAEPDMIEEMQRRMAEFDWEKEKKHAIDNFWAQQKDSVGLPVAEKNNERRIDTSIVSTQDIFHPDGRLIFKKGQTINPQAIMPMRHVYILFDATNKKQVEIAKKIGDEMLAKQKPVVYLFSKMDTEKGWEHYNQTTELMNAPIYKLNKTIIERFQIQALPSVVEGLGDTILVREIDARVLN
ncbi:TrbC family F-type conjugative pilus assembly protein [Methylophaga sp.]|uniref:TrbC family F-type conjugative pilus assembly protein n=1 Tax=Methylophaga sp. TaxID=2024840 RepID=UPI00271A2D70|nr:TrbC family F-type conjugative pilus assembly protein [Methylophaga sp.]MDO8827627.1 TrbC family F-type conjugative pilus assembly protein [Methylophaga sp.]